MRGPDAQRKLTTIVAIDAAGFSARTLADQDATVAGIAALSSRIAEVCGRHGGRLFNSAGDGFMLEFPTVSGALFAAAELVEDAEMPIRIGVHLGEVHVTPTGDLLGHGVNVAARIQALASPGSVLVSNDIRRAIRGAYAGRFVAHGAVRLDKMDETVQVFGLAKAGAGSRARLAWRRFKRPLEVMAVVALVALGAAWLWSNYTATATAAQARVAILPFDVLSDDPLTKTVANGVADEIATVLSGAQFVTIAADQTVSLRGAGDTAAVARLGAAFLMDGSVTRDGRILRVHVRLDDARAGVTIWSDSVSGRDMDASVVEADVASRAARIAILARMARRTPGGAELEPGVLTEFLKADDAIDSAVIRGSVTARSALQQVVAQAPGFARGHSALALADALISRWDAPDEHENLVRAARLEASKAMSLDPHSGEPYLALYQLVPWPNWVEREKVMLQGVSVEPDYQRMTSTRSNFLADLGRVSEAVAIIRRALGTNPLDRQANERYRSALTESGQFATARTAADQTFHVRPDGSTDLARLSLVMFYGSTQEAEILLRQSIANPYPGEAPALNAWDAFLKARQTRTAADTAKAVAAIKAAADQGSFPVRDAIPAFAFLGDPDAAFVEFPLLGQSVENSHIDFLWTPAGAPLLRDPRFWAFTAKQGMIQYWQTTGHWPDVCLGSGASVDCKALAAAATAA